jgi:hypothetical protein
MGIPDLLMGRVPGGNGAEGLLRFPGHVRVGGAVLGGVVQRVPLSSARA